MIYLFLFCKDIYYKTKWQSRDEKSLKFSLND